MSGRLGVVIDGVALPDEEARVIWERFSAHMDAHKGDLAGFAAAEGVVSVHPESRSGRAMLVISRVAPQRAYGEPVLPRSGGGSGSAQGAARSRPISMGNRGKRRR